jgi:hypothetical protein
LNTKSSKGAEGSVRIFLLIGALNIPFVVAFLYSAPILVGYLSGGLAASNYPLIVAYVAVSFLQIYWIITFGFCSRLERMRVKLGRAVLLYVLPISLVSTFLGAVWLGATGVVLGTLITYAVAISFSLKLGKEVKGIE